MVRKSARFARILMVVIAWVALFLTAEPLGVKGRYDEGLVRWWAGTLLLVSIAALYEPAARLERRRRRMPRDG